MPTDTAITLHVYDAQQSGRRNIELATVNPMSDGGQVFVITGGDSGSPDPIVDLSLAGAVQLASSLVELIGRHLGDARYLTQSLLRLADQAEHLDRIHRQIGA